jgi:hypothetical protein
MRKGLGCSASGTDFVEMAAGDFVEDSVSAEQPWFATDQSRTPLQIDPDLKMGVIAGHPDA